MPENRGEAKKMALKCSRGACGGKNPGGPSKDSIQPTSRTTMPSALMFCTPSGDAALMPGIEGQKKGSKRKMADINILETPNTNIYQL